MLSVPLSYNLMYKDDSLYTDSEAENVSSHSSLLLMSVINHKLFTGVDENDMIIEMVSNWPDDHKSILLNGIVRGRNKIKTHSPLFSEWTITEFMRNELINHDGVVDDDKFTASVELRICLKYLKFVDRLMAQNEHDTVVYNTDGSIDIPRSSFRSLIKQFLFTDSPDPMFEIITAFCILSNINDRYPQYVKRYLDFYNSPSISMVRCDLGQFSAIQI